MNPEDTVPKQRKIVDYKIVNLFYDQNNDMEAYLKRGYQPYGYPVIDDNNYMQAMVKYDDEKNIQKNKLFLDREIDSMDLFTRTENALKSASIYKIKDLKKLKYPFKIEGMGTKSWLELAMTLIYYITDNIKYED